MQATTILSIWRYAVQIFIYRFNISRGVVLGADSCGNGKRNSPYWTTNEKKRNRDDDGDDFETSLEKRLMCKNTEAENKQFLAFERTHCVRGCPDGMVCGDEVPAIGVCVWFASQRIVCPVHSLKWFMSRQLSMSEANIRHEPHCFFFGRWSSRGGRWRRRQSPMAMPAFRFTHLKMSQTIFYWHTFLVFQFICDMHRYTVYLYPLHTYAINNRNWSGSVLYVTTHFFYSCLNFYFWFISLHCMQVARCTYVCGPAPT